MSLGSMATSLRAAFGCFCAEAETIDEPTFVSILTRPGGQSPLSAERAKKVFAAIGGGEATVPISKIVDAWSRPALLVGSLNCLGDAHNPFEFMCDDASFEKSYKVLHDAALQLSWDGFAARCGAELLAASGVGGGAAAAVGRLRTHCEGGAPLWTFFDEATLHNDNKLTAPRLNLLTFALRPHGADARPSWLLRDSWREEMRSLVAQPDSPYAKDANLFVWDLACNAVADTASAEYAAVCESSHLNPANFEALARQFALAVKTAAAGRAVVLGLQEWPPSDSPKGRAYAAAFAAHGLRVLSDEDGGGGGSGCAIAYSEEALGAPELVDVSCTRGVMQAALDGAAASGDALDAKAVKGCLETTARKVLAVRFPAATAAAAAVTRATFVVVHAKEPKNEAAAKVLGRFVAGLGSALGSPSTTGEVASPAVVTMLDSNLPSAALCGAFGAALGEARLDSQPPPEVDTTCKMRSRLHGQTYDKKKCEVLVRAPKDKLVAPAGTLSAAATFPRVDEIAKGLPSPTWASDHALTTAVLKL